MAKKLVVGNMQFMKRWICPYCDDHVGCEDMGFTHQFYFNRM